MSGSGGFYRYRCKYFYTHNCPNWVYVNNAPCTACLAEGRDAEDNVSAVPVWRLSREIFVPRVHDGTLQYTLMEIVATDKSGNDWKLRYKATQPPAFNVTTTSDTPNPVYSSSGAPIHGGY